jgi:pSer/pThr/pTyr-binding forkhead associated (FHA) protein
MTPRFLDQIRRWFDPPVEADATPLEIKEAILDDIERHVEPAGSGRRALPYDRIEIVLLAAHKDDRARLQAALSDLQDVVSSRLKEIHCSPPPALKIDVRYVTRPRSDWTPTQRMAIGYIAPEPDGAGGATTTPPPLHVTILRGAASQPTYALAERRIHIGRSPHPVDGRGRPRVNHIVFLEDGDEHSRTVGRAHASIVYDARGEYRLFDDGSHNGTRIVRNGVMLEIGPRDPVGATIQSGDEIQIGTAAIRIELPARSS